MAQNSKIGWTDHTFNPWRGCQKVAPGCKFCYAEKQRNRYGEDFLRRRILLADAGWREPLKWNKDAAEGKCSVCRGGGSVRTGKNKALPFMDCPRCHGSGRLGDRPRVFCASLADVFEDWGGIVTDRNGHNYIVRMSDSGDWYRRANYVELLPENMEPMRLHHVRRRLFNLIDSTPHLDWLLLTKRPENIVQMWNAVDTRPAGNLQMKRENVWLGNSASEQKTANENIPELLRCRHLASVLFLSAEPLLGAIDLTTIPIGGAATENEQLDALTGDMRYIHDGSKFGKQASLDWVIAGGESGPQARQCDVDSIDWLWAQCDTAQVPLFVKQLGDRPFDKRVNDPQTYPLERCWPASTVWKSVGSAYPHLRSAKGEDWTEWPERWRVRQFPQVTT